MTSRPWLRACVLALIAAVTAGSSCGRGRSSRPNIVLIAIDSLRADCADGVGSALATGPRLRRLASEGTVFTQAVSTAPWTTPSMMSVLTGLFPWSHHVRDHNFTLSPRVTLLSERLQTLGYRTAAIVPDATLREDFGFARGFDFYDNGRYGHETLSSPAMTGKALSWMQANADQPFFCWIHLWDPHYDYIPPSPFDRAFPSSFRPAAGTTYDMSTIKFREAPLRPEECDYLRSQYEGEILYTDRYVGEILDFLAQKAPAQGTLVVVLGDHGEAFQEHRWLTHTSQVYEEMVHVPLVFHWPGHVRPGARIDSPTSLIGVAPTILDLIGSPAEAGDMEGTSLAAALTGPASAPAGPIVSETIRQASLTSWRADRWKYVLNMDTCEDELYDVVADPHETKNLRASEAERARTMREALVGWYRDNAWSKRVPVMPMGRVQPEDLERLRSLGYLPSPQMPATFTGHTDPLHCR